MLNSEMVCIAAHIHCNTIYNRYTSKVGKPYKAADDQHLNFPQICGKECPCGGEDVAKWDVTVSESLP